MTIVFQIIAVVAVIVAAFFMLRGGGARHQAVRRLLLLLFIVAAVVSIFFPQLLTFVANLVGIGRGADLLLYITVLVFLGFVATTYRQFRRMERDTTELARKVALLEARDRPGGSPDSGS